MSATTTARVEAADTDRRRPPIGDWEQITARAPRLAATVDAYLGELAETRSPATVHAVSATLRQFAGYVSVVDPSCTTAAGITGHHVGDYCLWLALHPERRTRRTVTAGGIDRRIGELRRFFEHLSERRDADAPVLVPVPARRRRSRAPARDVIDGSGAPAFRPAAVASWGEIAQRAPQVAATMTAYLDQIAVSSRPSTVDCAGLALRQFADHLTVTDPACVVGGRGGAASHRVVQARARRPPWPSRPGVDPDDPPPARDVAHVLRADHRLGRSRRAAPGAGSRR